MSDPVLHLLAGPNGAGKTTFFVKVLEPVTHLPFVNADLIAAERWPDHAAERSYDAATMASDQRAALISRRQSFVTETVFSHPSKVELLREARDAGYLVQLHVVMIPVELAIARVDNRVSNGGHSVPEVKIRERFDRLWSHVREALSVVDEARAYDNTRAATPYQLVATWRGGQLVGEPSWPAWTPEELKRLGP